MGVFDLPETIPPSRGPRSASRNDKSSYLDEAKRADYKTVNSSNVNAIAYNSSKKHLFIEFYDIDGKKPNTLYIYFDFSETEWEAFEVAPSMGQFVWYYIRNDGKDNRFDYLQLY